MPRGAKRPNSHKKNYWIRSVTSVLYEITKLKKKLTQGQHNQICEFKETFYPYQSVKSMWDFVAINNNKNLREKKTISIRRKTSEFQQFLVACFDRRYEILFTFFSLSFQNKVSKLYYLQIFAKQHIFVWRGYVFARENFEQQSRSKKTENCVRRSYVSPC